MKNIEQQLASWNYIYEAKILERKFSIPRIAQSLAEEFVKCAIKYVVYKLMPNADEAICMRLKKELSLVYRSKYLIRRKNKRNSFFLIEMVCLTKLIFGFAQKMDLFGSKMSGRMRDPELPKVTRNEIEQIREQIIFTTLILTLFGYLISIKTYSLVLRKFNLLVPEKIEAAAKKFAVIATPKQSMNSDSSLIFQNEFKFRPCTSVGQIPRKGHRIGFLEPLKSTVNEPQQSLKLQLRNFLADTNENTKTIPQYTKIDFLDLLLDIISTADIEPSDQKYHTLGNLDKIDQQEQENCHQIALKNEQSEKEHLRSIRKRVTKHRSQSMNLTYKKRTFLGKNNHNLDVFNRSGLSGRSNTLQLDSKEILLRNHSRFKNGSGFKSKLRNRGIIELMNSSSMLKKKNDQQTKIPIIAILPEMKIKLKQKDVINTPEKMKTPSLVSEQKNLKQNRSNSQKRTVEEWRKILVQLKGNPHISAAKLQILRPAAKKLALGTSILDHQSSQSEFSPSLSPQYEHRPSIVSENRKSKNVPSDVDGVSPQKSNPKNLAKCSRSNLFSSKRINAALFHA